MYKLNRKTLLILILLITMGLSLSGCKKGEFTGKDGIIAKVNGDVITEKEFNGEFEMLKNMYKKQLGDDILSQKTEEGKTYEDVLMDNLLESMILEKLIGKEMEKLDIMVTDEEIEKVIKVRYIDGLGGEEKYKEFLEANNFTEDFLKSSLRKSMMDEKYREDFFSKTEVPEDEIKEYYDSHKDSLVQVKASLIQAETEEDGTKILERLEKGEDFHELATTESIDPVTAAKGGDIGYFAKGTLKSFHELEEAAFSLGKGETSDLIESQSGYYIILVEDRKEEYEDLKENIIPILKNEKYVNKLSELKAGADVEIHTKKKDK